MTRTAPAFDELLAHAESEIVAVDCFPALFPLTKPLVMSTYRLDDGPVLFVRLTARGGQVGWGEAAASPVMSGENLAGMASALRQQLAPGIVGRSAHDRVRILRDIRSVMHGNGGVLAAIDMAMLDLAGHLLEVPAYELLGGAARRTVPVLRLIGGSGSFEQDVQDGTDLAAQGYKAFKLKVGVAPLAQEIETVHALRRQLGPDALIGADANMGWDRQTALRFLQGVEDAGLAFLEQPLPPDSASALAELRQRTAVPLSIDEALHGIGDLRAHLAIGAIDGVSLKSIKLGGVTTTVDVGVVAHAMGLRVNIAMMMESGLATSAMIHAACALPAIDWGLSLGAQWLRDNPFALPRCVDGGVACFTSPGLGVMVDPGLIQSLAP